MRRALLGVFVAILALATSSLPAGRSGTPLAGEPEMTPLREPRVVEKKASRAARRIDARRRASPPLRQSITTPATTRRGPTKPQALAALAWAESRAVSLANAARAGAGESSCAVSARLARYARSHSYDMARGGRMFHSSASQLWAACGSCSYVGEVVGVGETIEQVHRAMMRSASHRATILGARYRLIGAGVVKRGRWLYVTEIYAG